MRLGATSPAHHVPHTVIARVTRCEVPPDDRPDHVLVTADPASADLDGYGAVLLEGAAVALPSDVPYAVLPEPLSYLADGDVVKLHPHGYVRTLHRRSSPHNFILATEMCNSLCLMCSQPPRDVDDSLLVAENLRLIDLIGPGAGQLGITGGEPTLLGDGFLRLVERCKERLPNTTLHVLSNGRLFYYREFARRLGSIGHAGLTMGIPLYSDIDRLHDAVVDSDGAYEQTVIGLQHLAEFGVSVEIRVVLHRMTVDRLAKLAAFIARNLPFVDHVALMGLELTGLVHQNLDALWIDPYDYQDSLVEAVGVLEFAGVPVSIYNHQLCVLRGRLWPYARRSISDWKNVYIGACDACSVRSQCGGFFESGVRRTSAHIRPLVGDHPGSDCGGQR